MAAYFRFAKMRSNAFEATSVGQVRIKQPRLQNHILRGAYDDLWGGGLGLTGLFHRSGHTYAYCT